MDALLARFRADARRLETAPTEGTKSAFADSAPACRGRLRAVVAAISIARLSYLKWGAIGVGALAGVGLMLYFATGDPASSDSLPALAAQMLAKTALVLGLLFLTLAGLKRWQTGGARTRRLSVVETLRLSPRQSLHLVRVGERYLLIGASEAQVSLLTEVTELPAADAGSPSSAFVQLLDQSQKQL